MIRKIISMLLLFILLQVLHGVPLHAAADGGLTAAIRATLGNHPAVKGKLAELSAYGFNIDTAKSGRYPSLSGEVQTLGHGDEYGRLAIRQPLWAFGKIQLPIKHARERFKAEHLALLQVQRQLMEETAATYARLLGIRKQLEVANENINEHSKLYERIEHRQGGQLASEADVQLALSRLIQAQVQREQIVGELQVGLNELRALTQINIESGMAVDPALSALPEKEAIREQALQQNAGIRYKKKLIGVAQYNVSIQKVASTPTLYAEAWRNFFDSSIEKETRFGITLMGTLNGAGLGIRSRTRSAMAQVDAARQDWLATKNDVELRIDSLLTNLDLQARLERSLQAAVEAVRKTSESFIRQYDTGRKSWLEVLNIQRELTQQRLMLVQSGSDQLVLKLRLAALLGRIDTAAGLEPIVE